MVFLKLFLICTFKDKKKLAENWRDLAISLKKPTFCHPGFILFQIGHFSAFLHNSYGTSEFPDCENLVGADCIGNLRWANMEPSMHFRKTNSDLSVHFRKADTDPSMHFRKANTEF